MADQVEELEGSELGTKDYWDGRYDMEIKNFQSHGDVGEIWFDECSQDRIIKALSHKLQIAENERIIDIGKMESAISSKMPTIISNFSFKVPEMA